MRGCGVATPALVSGSLISTFTNNGQWPDLDRNTNARVAHRLMSAFHAVTSLSVFSQFARDKICICRQRRGVLRARSRHRWQTWLRVTEGWGSKAGTLIGGR